MNRYLIITNESKKALNLKSKLIKLIPKDWLEDNINYEWVFIIGGDGTFLRSKHYYCNKKIIPINGGSLGYFSHFNDKNIKTIFKNISNEANFIIPYILKCKSNDFEYEAINEILIRSDATLITNIYIDNFKYETFRGTGLMICTPFGSTGHSKSANGAIFCPHINLMQLLEIEPIAQKEYLTLKSPLILEKNTILTFKHNSKKISSQQMLSSIIIDGQIINEKFDGSELKIFMEKANFFLYNPSNKKMFLKKLQNSFIRERE